MPFINWPSQVQKMMKKLHQHMIHLYNQLNSVTYNYIACKKILTNGTQLFFYILIYAMGKENNIKMFTDQLLPKRINSSVQVRGLLSFYFIFTFSFKLNHQSVLCKATTWNTLISLSTSLFATPECLTHMCLYMCLYMNIHLNYFFYIAITN